MEFNKREITFNREERWVAGLPEAMPIADANGVLSVVRRAHGHCYQAFVDLLTCDLDLLSDAEAKTIPLYPERLERLDELSQKLVSVVAPQIIAELHKELPRLPATP